MARLLRSFPPSPHTNTASFAVRFPVVAASVIQRRTDVHSGTRIGSRQVLFSLVMLFSLAIHLLRR